MHRRVIYQSLAWVPVAAGAAISAAVVVTSSQVVSKTVIYEDRTTFADIPSVAAEVITTDKWYAPLDIPVRERRRITDQQELAQPPSDAAGPAIAGFDVTTASQVISKTIIYDESAYAPFTPAPAEGITIDKWWRELAVPVRRRFTVAEEGSLFLPGGQPEANDQIAWHQSLNWPMRRKVIVEGAYWSAPPIPGANDQIAWWRELERPTRATRLPVTAGLSFVAAAPGSGTEYNWFSGLDLPVRRRVALQTDLDYGNFTPSAAEDVTVDKWWRQLDLPVRRRFVVPSEPVAQELLPRVAWGWYAKLDEPPRVKRLSTGQISLTFVAAAPSDATAQNWFHQLDTPTRARRLYEFPATAIPVYFVPPVAGAGNEYDWWQQLDEPVRPRPSIKAAQQLSLTAPGSINPLVPYVPNYLDVPHRLKGRIDRQTVAWGNFSPVVPWDWYASLEGSARRLKKTPVGQLAPTFVAAAPGAGVAYNWFTQLDEPLRIKRTPKTDLGWNNFLLTPVEVVTIDKWWRELVRPTRRIKPVPQQQGYTFVAAAPGSGVAYNWFQALDTPTRRDRRRIADQQFLAYSNFTPPRIFYAATVTSAQIFRRAFIFDPEALPPLGVSFPARYDVTVRVNLTVTFGRLQRRVCLAQQEDDSVTQGEQTSGWQTQAENAIDSVVESEQTPDWQTEAESEDAFTEQPETDPWGCGGEET